MKTAIIVTFFNLIFFQSLFSQDSKQEYSNFSNKEIQIEATKSLENWNYYMRNNLDSLKIDAYRILVIGLEGKNDFAINVGKRSLGSYLIRTGDPINGINYLKQANTYFEIKSNAVLQTEILNEIGNGYLNNGRPIEAEKYFLKSLKCGSDSPDPTSYFLAEVNLAQAYIILEKLDKATAILQHYKKEALKHLKFEAVSNAYSLLGKIEELNKNISLAKEYYRKSAKYGFRSKSKAQIAHAYNNMAIVYFEENEFVKSLEYFNHALKIRLQTKNAKSISESYYNLGDYYKELKKYDEALKYFLLCEEYSKEKNLIIEEMEAVLAISKVFELDGNWEKAFKKMEVYSELQKKYYSELQESKTEDLENMETINNLDLQLKSESNETKLLLALENQKLHKKTLFYILGFSLTVFIALMIFKKKIN